MSSGEVVRPPRAGRGSRRTSHWRLRTSDSPLAAPDLELLATCAFMLGRDDESIAWLERAHQRYLEDGRDAARSPLCGVDRLEPRAPAARSARRPGGSAGLSGSSRTRASAPSAAYLLLPVMFQHEAAGDFAAAAASRRRSCSHRRALRRPRPLRPRNPRPGLHADQGRTGSAKGSRCSTRPWSRSPPRSSRRSSPGSSTAASSSRARRSTRCSARASGRERSRTGGRSSPRWSRSRVGASCTAPRSCSWTALGGTRWTRRAARVSGSSRRRIRRPASRGIGRESSSGCRASSPPPSGPTRRRVGFGWEPQPGLAQLRLAQGRAEAAAAAIRRARVGDHRSRSSARGCFRRSWRSCSRSARPRPRARRVPRARRARTRLTTARCWQRWSPMRRAPCISPRGRTGRARRLASARETWHALEAPYEIARTRVLAGEACRLLGDEEAADAGARGGEEHLRAPRREAGSRAVRGSDDGRRTRTLAAGARGPAARRLGEEQSRDRSRARDQRAHGRAARPEHLREARALLARCGDRVRLRARPRLERLVVRTDHDAPAPSWWIRAMRGRRAVLPLEETTRRMRWQRQ